MQFDTHSNDWTNKNGRSCGHFGIQVDGLSSDIYKLFEQSDKQTLPKVSSYLLFCVLLHELIHSFLP